MGKPPLTPGGGKADFLGLRLAQGQAARLDKLAERLGYRNRSEYVRALLSEQLASEDHSQEDARAS
jgi:metal-responsive CopG/Arc/MetJ family transcriptional regulator